MSPTLQVLCVSLFVGIEPGRPEFNHFEFIDFDFIVGVTENTSNG
jgi:hypothetical protein